MGTTPLQTQTAEYGKRAPKIIYDRHLGTGKARTINLMINVDVIFFM